MGTQLHHLTTPRAWGAEVVQAHSAWNLDAQQVVSHGGLKLLERIPEPSSMRSPSTCVALAANTDPEHHHPFYPHLSPAGRPWPAVGLVSGAYCVLTLTLTVPLTETLHQNLRLPRKLTLYLCRLVPWALTSALEGNHETRVTSALATSLDRNLTLAKALC